MTFERFPYTKLTSPRAGRTKAAQKLKLHFTVTNAFAVEFEFLRSSVVLM